VPHLHTGAHGHVSQRRKLGARRLRGGNFSRHGDPHEKSKGRGDTGSDEERHIQRPLPAQVLHVTSFSGLDATPELFAAFFAQARGRRVELFLHLDRARSLLTDHAPHAAVLEEVDDTGDGERSYGHEVHG
jgi:hypothetical protein